ncbi:MAG TPA: glycoside hydrolase family 15 protein, partial [Actinopolymorphaceae bacterium]|nr:glycoside hydrolase family 15 protein [Actinopolymorphaceae bacterium]
MERYPAISDHGLIGDLQTAALVSTDGTVDWYCCPRFDSPSVFASLLDHDRGGHFRIAPDRDDYVTRQLYFPDTAILMTRFMTTDGVGEVLDFMPIAGDRHADRAGNGSQSGNGTKATDRHRLARRIRVVRGTLRFVGEVQPRFDYGRRRHKLEMSDDGARFHADDLSLTLHLSGAPDRSPDGDGVEMTPDGDGIRLSWTLRSGQEAGVVLESEGGPARRIPTDELLEEFHRTAAFWRAWLRRSTYRGRWQEMVSRSAMTLKLMTYAPTGAVIAAPTAALPEQVGGERNWDYRFTWIRDSSFSIYSLLGLGYLEEAGAYAGWLRERIAERAGDQSGPLKIMYRVDGSSDLDEEILDHLEGYKGSRPVRVGNGAADQLQLDIYGELMDSLHLADSHGLQVGHDGWLQLTKIVDWLCEHWDQPDEGIWETRGGREAFTYGRFQSWVAFDRAIRVARNRGRPADHQRWIKERDIIY